MFGPKSYVLTAIQLLLHFIVDCMTQGIVPVIGCYNLLSQTVSVIHVLSILRVILFYWILGSETVPGGGCFITQNNLWYDVKMFGFEKGRYRYYLMQITLVMRASLHTLGIVPSDFQLFVAPFSVLDMGQVISVALYPSIIHYYWLFLADGRPDYVER